ncbi:MAG: hypothetical protein KF718_32595 [Polyangiaceae bacterium]|nr:hypothetical protein [Polyangiaceae bacterium]
MLLSRFALLAPLCLFSCGGAVAAGSGAARADEQSSGDADSKATGHDETSPSAAAAACQDADCFACGEGLCPKGFYCDRQAPGGPACSWLPECATNTSCACLGRVLGDACACTESGGGSFCG